MPGRREDGIVKGKRLLRRFFRNIVRGVIGVPIDIVLSIAGGGAATTKPHMPTVTRHRPTWPDGSAFETTRGWNDETRLQHNPTD